MKFNFFPTKTKIGLAGAAFALTTLTAGMGPAQAFAQDRAHLPGASGQMDRAFGAQRETGGWMGVAIEDATAANAGNLKLKDIHGVVISDVGENSPASKAGLKKGDVVTEYNGGRVEGAIEFRRMVHETPAGHVAQLSVWRDGRSEKISVEIGQPRNAEGPAFDSQLGPNLPDNFSDLGRALGNQNGGFAGPDEGFPGGRLNRQAQRTDSPRLGVAAQDLTPKLGSYFNVPDGDGVLITDVRPGSAGEKAGLQAGDVIKKIDNEQVHNLAELRTQLRAKREAKTITLGLMRKGTQTSVSVEFQAPQSGPQSGRQQHGHSNGAEQKIPL